MIRKIIVLLGKPGSGKGIFTQFIIENDQSFIHVGTGNLARKESQKNTQSGQEIRTIIANGTLLSDHLIAKLLFAQILNNNHNIICDGFPRSLDQFKIWQTFLKNHQFEVSYWIINCSDDLVLQRINGRLLCSNCNRVFHQLFKKPLQDNICDHCHFNLIKRIDDLKSGHRRLHIFNQKTKPLITLLSSKKDLNVKQFDGKLSLNEIKKNIKNYFNN